MKRSILILMAVLIVVAGCSHTVNVPLRPDYDQEIYSENQLSQVKAAIKFVKGAYEDKRTDDSKLATFKQGIHTYNLYDERPIDEALFEGLNVLTTTSGHEWSDADPGKVKVNLQLLNFHAARNAGFIKVGATSGIQIKLDFVDADTDNLIYSQIYNGEDERDQALIGLMDLVLKSIDGSIVNCINSVGDDEGLAKALKNL